MLTVCKFRFVFIQFKFVSIKEFNVRIKTRVINACINYVMAYNDHRLNLLNACLRLEIVLQSRKLRYHEIGYGGMFCQDHKKKELGQTNESIWFFSFCWKLCKKPTDFYIYSQITILVLAENHL